METSVPDSLHNATNATRDVESEYEAGQEGKIREIVMDNVDTVSIYRKTCRELAFVFIFLRNSFQETAPFGVQNLFRQLVCSPMHVCDWLSSAY